MSFLHFVLGPKLYMEYGIGSSQKMYEPNGLERIGDQIMSMFSIAWNLGCYASPLLIMFLYRRGFLVTESFPTIAKLTTSIGFIFIVSLWMRGLGRYQSRTYVKMIKALEQAKLERNPDGDGKRALRGFDIEFSSWPIDFDIDTLSDKKKSPFTMGGNLGFRGIKFATLPCDIAAYIAMHTFGIRLIYPGSVRILQNYMRGMLISGRAKLIEDENAIRYKIKTIDKNEIDTIFVDNRNHSNSVNGKMLVICSEGNAGFYEIGIMTTPLELKYSVVGWNHPGFESSTGKPYPDQDKNAVDAVVQFAIHKLGFKLENIILYGWSIGAFSALSAAEIYPEIKGVILDATFDDVLYLAQPRMPASLAGVVRNAIRNYCNLNNAELIVKYHGPVLLIRRTEDEIIAEENHIETNRGNYLALTLLKYRYPHIFKLPQISYIKQQLLKPLEPKNFNNSTDDLCMSRFITYASDKGKTYPMKIGEDYTDEIRKDMAEFLLRKYLRDYKSTHCTQLPVEYFSDPWDIPLEKGFVFN